MKKQFKLRKYKINENYFNIIDSENKAYILGFISADGGVKDKVLTIAQSSKNGEILLEWIKNELNSNHILYLRKRKKITHNDAYILQITSPQIIEDLNKYNILENKKYNNEFPNLLNIKYFKQYIRGYFDGDGCVGIYYEKKKKNNKFYYSKYLKLSFYGTKNFIVKCNELFPESIKGRILLSKNNKHAEIIWTNKKARIFGEWLFENSDNLPNYVKNTKYLNYINEYKITPILSERVSKIVIQKDINNNIINEYKSISEVKKILNININGCLKGLNKTAGGYKWEYK